ncbi:MAG: hypothetical protein AAGG11_23070 [Pseudomonadota bacterium]
MVPERFWFGFWKSEPLVNQEASEDRARAAAKERKVYEDRKRIAPGAHRVNEWQERQYPPDTQQWCSDTSSDNGAELVA